MTRWPPLLWVCVYAASLFILVGLGGRRNPDALIPGIVLALIAFGLALYLAYGKRDRPRATGLAWMVPATAVWYLINAAAGAIAGAKYVIVAIAAGIIPMTAAALVVATARVKTEGEGDRHIDQTPEGDSDPFPGVGMDDETPLGDTPEHSDAERVAKPEPRFQRRQRSRAKP